MTTLILAALLATAPMAPETRTDLARAERDVATAHAVQDACWTPRECLVARELVAAAEDALSSARTLAGAAAVAAEVDPFAPADPFADDWPPFAGAPLPSDADVASMIAEGESIAGKDL